MRPMSTPADPAAPVERVMVATDRSETADRAVRWAADLAARSDAHLFVVQVLMPGGTDGEGSHSSTQATAQELARFATQLAGERGHARVIVGDDPALTIVEAAEADAVDTLVVGNAGMSGRKEFLLGNVPNRISHNARCNVIIVNTTGGGVTATSGPIGLPRASRARDDIEPRLIGRATKIATVMAKHGVKALFDRTGDDADRRRQQARQLRSAMEELGPTFAKLGQILSTRPDLLPPEFIDELASLRDAVPPLTEAEVVQVMEQELGVPWEDVFETIDPQPLAAGTIAQVHRATLTGGTKVVVKVQRPTAREDIMQDLALLEVFAEKTEQRPALRQVVDMPAVFEHLASSLQRELDFRTEAGNIERMREVLRGYDRLAVPGVYSDLSSSRLLVLQEIEGVPIEQAPASDESKEAARQLLESFYRQILVDGFFHADPHPGNLLWWDGVIYFLDLGMVGELGPGMRENLTLLLMAFWQQDVAFLTDVSLMLAGDEVPPDLDVAAFREEIGTLVASQTGLSLQDIELGPILQQMTEISIRHDVPLPASLALTGKALAQMQLAVAQLDPDLDPFDVAGTFMMRTLTGRIRDKLDPKRLFYESQKLRVRLSNLVEAFERLTGTRPGPKLQVNFAAENLEETVRRVGRRLSAGIVAGSALLGAAIAASSERVPVWVPIALGVIGIVFVGGLLADLVRRHR